MSKAKFHVKRGDTVQVISGNHRGSSGRILQVLPEKAQVIIEGVRLIKKHQRKTQDNPNGAIIEREGPIHISNVKIVERAQFGKGQDQKARPPRNQPQMNTRFARIRMGIRRRSLRSALAIHVHSWLTSVRDLWLRNWNQNFLSRIQDPSRARLARKARLQEHSRNSQE